MNAEFIRNALHEGTSFNGIWRTLPSDAITEIVALAGYDFQIFDLEHGALDWSEVQTMVRINNALGKISLIRLGDRSPVAAQRALDSGAQGLVYPQVDNIEDIKALAENLSFAPIGRRGFNPFVSAFGYGAQRTIDGGNPLLIPIIETKAGLASIEAISSHPSVDIIYLGAYDLSVQLGTPGDIQSDVVLAAMRSAVEVCKKNKCAVGVMAATTETIKLWSDSGVLVFLQGVDGGILRNAFELKNK